MMEFYESHSSFGESESSFDSEASRVNFWKDINTKDEAYGNAIVSSLKTGKGEDKSEYTSQGSFEFGKKKKGKRGRAVGGGGG